MQQVLTMVNVAIVRPIKHGRLAMTMRLSMNAETPWLMISNV
nr:MAG TPA: membrane protein [Caudoviricetes sp.]